ncbi:hypothetical protein [Craterilacuibacter sp.]|uniref:hypothetical protein n=1 Tax=Craterilacuibacter sp. TaxID=2870909 RepID=UPI003F2CFFCF
MIEIDQAGWTEPAGFDAGCRQKGAAWLVKNPKATRKTAGKRPKDYWSKYKPDLAVAFGDLCAYGAMYEPVGTVDHFQPVDANESLTYEWENFRFASGWINSSKNKAVTILDPLLVKEGWFKLLLPSLQLVTVPENIPDDLRELAQQTLIRLHLRDDERVMRQRRKWYQMYQEGRLPLESLREVAPLIAAAVNRQRLPDAVGQE